MKRMMTRRARVKPSMKMAARPKDRADFFSIMEMGADELVKFIDQTVDAIIDAKYWERDTTILRSQLNQAHKAYMRQLTC